MKEIMIYLELFSKEEKQVTEIFCLVGTSDWFGLVNVTEVSCFSRLEPLKI